MNTFLAYSIRLYKLLEQKLQIMSMSTYIDLSIMKNSKRPLLRMQTISNIIEFTVEGEILSYELKRIV